MIKGKSVLAVIPARGGSKGVPRKNIRELAGKPLIAWTIEEAKKSKYIDRLILSSEDEEIIDVAKKWGCEVPFVRPKELAQDETPGIEPVLHAVNMLTGYDYVVLLQPTSPLRNSEDIDGSIEMCLYKQALSCVSVTEVDKNPYWMYFLNAKNHMEPVINNSRNYKNRQEIPRIYALNGSVYISNIEQLIAVKSFVESKTIAYPMPKIRSVDIDDEVDFQVAEYLRNTSINF